MARSTGGRRSVVQVGEFGLIARLLRAAPAAPGTLIGPGQDCAVLRCGARRMLFTVDALVEGVHFAAGWLSPYQLGRKSFLINASDIAAMGGRPHWCVVSLGVPSGYAAADVSRLQAGIAAAARQCGAGIVGGNLSRSEVLFVSIALLGEAPRRLVTRRGARCGDRIYVTGRLGDAALAVRLLRRGHGGRRRTGPVRRFCEPPPRLAAGRFLAESGTASAMIDVSDGLAQDLGHICAASGVSAVIHADRVPLSPAGRAALAAGDVLALRGGEDYELLCTVPEHNVRLLERSQMRLGCAITCIGRVGRGRGVQVVGADGEPVDLGSAGYDHFRDATGRTRGMSRAKRNRRAEAAVVRRRAGSAWA